MKRLIAMVTCVLLLLTLLPLGAVSAADAAAPVVVGGVPLQEGDYLAVGADAPQTTKPTGGYAHYKDGTLTLNNYTYEGVGYEYSNDYYALVFCRTLLRLHLVGENVLSEYAPLGYVTGVWARGSLIVTADSGGSLSITVNTDGILVDYCDCAILGGTIDIYAGRRALNIVSGYMLDDVAPPAAGGGLRPGLTIENSNVTVRSKEDSVRACYLRTKNSTITLTSRETYGIWTWYNIEICDSNVTVNGKTGALQAIHDILIDGGAITATGGIYTQKNITINSGTVVATGAQRSIATASGEIAINGGTVTAVGKDNGIHTQYGDVVINGGTVIATAEKGSGIYSTSGDVIINGGRVNATSLAKNDLYWALKSYNGTVTVNENLYQVGSFTPDGELIPYDAAQSKEFDRVIICCEHLYDGVCDGDCNHCGTARTAKAHTWKNGKCSVCGKASPSKVKITAVPATARYAKAGAAVSAKVTAKGDGLKYRWYVKNAGATKYSKSSITKATYSVSMSAKVKGRRVYCVVTDKYGNKVQSKTFILRESVSIATQPKTVAVKKNATAKVTVKAKGDGLKYQWYVKNAGAAKYSKSSVKTSTYRTTMTAKAKNRLLLCIITDQYGNKVQTKTVKLKMK